MRLTTIFHFLNFKQNFSCGIIDDRVDITIQNKFTILSLEKIKILIRLKKLLVNLIKYQMSFEFTFAKLFRLNAVYFY